MTHIQVPFLGEGIHKVVVSCWYRKVGDTITEEEDIVELSADKAIFNLSAPCPGILRKILVTKNEEARIGETLGIVE